MPDEAGQLLFGLECVGLQELGQLGQDLREYLLQEEVFQASEEGLRRLGFWRLVDEARWPGHVCYEDNFHGLPTGAAATCLFPRSPGPAAAAPEPEGGFRRQAAPLRLRALCEALRRANAGALGALAAAAPEGSLPRRLLRGGFGFADVCCQVHFGAAVPAGGVAWHVDRPGSMLHVALGLRGWRTVHALLRPASAGERAAAVRGVERAHARTLEARFDRARAQIAEVARTAPADGGADPLLRVAHARRAGDAYACNAISYVHGVEYPSAGWDDRVIAVQLRLLLDGHEDFDPLMEWGADSVAAALTTTPLRLPSLREVREAAFDLERGQRDKQERPALGLGDPVQGKETAAE